MAHSPFHPVPPLQLPLLPGAKLYWHPLRKTYVWRNPPDVSGVRDKPTPYPGGRLPSEGSSLESCV